MIIANNMATKIKLTDLHLWQSNPRVIKDKRFEALCKSMTDDPAFLELRPVLATKEGRIYAGNQRYRAAQHLGWTEINAVITDIPEKLANERAIRDNNEFGEWNNDELATILDEMEKAGTVLDTLGLDNFIEDFLKGMPDFQPASIDEQGRLDEKKPITCPNCKHEFTT